MKKKITTLLIIANIILIGLICSFISKNGNIIKEKQIIKEMNESTQVSDLNNQINALNAEHTEYANYVQNCKQTIATAITNQGVETSIDNTVEVMAKNIGKIASNKYEQGYNEGYTKGYETSSSDGIKIENLIWNYKEITAMPVANSASMTWDVTSIPNYEKLELNKTLNPVMVSTFDMGNWSTSYSRAWKISWGYNATTGTLSAWTTGGPIVQYGTGIVARTVGIYYLEF